MTIAISAYPNEMYIFYVFQQQVCQFALILNYMFPYRLDRFSPRGDFCDTDSDEYYTQTNNFRKGNNLASYNVCENENKNRFKVAI